jgi:23S rRNA pseudouridine1911/1915/1917 synthase
VRLFENDSVVALDKPPGVSMATAASDPGSAARVVATLLEACGERPDPTLRLVHRLDVGTSGVVLLAKTDEAHRALSRLFQSRAARKTYRAVVWGHPRPARGTFDDPLARDPKDGRRMKPAVGGKPSITDYRTVARLASVADLELSPRTGRTHQIRVHLFAHGHPIVGDDLYGGATRWHGVTDPRLRRCLAEVSRPLLHAARIEIAEMDLDVSAPLPSDYSRMLETLSSGRA